MCNSRGTWHCCCCSCCCWVFPLPICLVILPGCCVFFLVSCHRQGSSSRECAVLEKTLLLLLGLWLCPSAAPAAAGFAYPQMEMDLSTRTAALHFQGAATATAPAAVAPIRWHSTLLSKLLKCLGSFAPPSAFSPSVGFVIVTQCLIEMITHGCFSCNALISIGEDPRLTGDDGFCGPSSV